MDVTYRKKILALWFLFFMSHSIAASNPAFPPRIVQFNPIPPITNESLLAKREFYNAGWIELFEADDANGLHFVKVRLSNDNRFHSAHLSVSLTCLDEQNISAWFEKSVGIGLKGRIEHTRYYVVDCQRLLVSWLPHKKGGAKGTDILKDVYHSKFRARTGRNGRANGRN